MALANAFWTGLRMFDDQMQTAYNLLQTYESNIFGANSGGAIVFGQGSQSSTIAEKANWDRLDDLIVFRDPAADGAEPATTLNQYKTNEVKVALRMGPKRLDTSSARWKGIPTDRLGFIYGAQLAARWVNQRADMAIAALKGGFGNAKFNPVKTDIAIAPASTLPTAQAANKATLTSLHTAAAKLGASYSMIRTWLMHGDVFHSIMGDNLQNANRLFTFGTVDVYAFLGKRFLVTDNPQLVKAAVTSGGSRHPNEYYTFGLLPASVSCLAAGEFDSTTEKPTRVKNITVYVQAQDAVIMSMRNLYYKPTTPPQSLGDLSNAANWDSDIGTWDRIDYMGVQLVSNA